MPVSSSGENLEGPDRPPLDDPHADWRDELSERVESFRKRRSRFQSEADPATPLELDFDGRGESQDYPSLDPPSAAPEHQDAGFDLEIGEFVAARGKDSPSPERLSLEGPSDETVQLDSVPVESDGMILDAPLASNPPLEIVVDSPIQPVAEIEAETKGKAGQIYLATLGRRFLAGLADALVLILGAAVFGVIFWRFCGRLSLVPLNVAVLGVIAVILIFAYFAVFTAIASATPGLLWLGCEIRDFGGGYPTVRESLWRAFGVLVSLSAIMLGFVWACVDSDGLTWHDRMSGTAITSEYNHPDFAEVKSEI